MSLKYLLVVFSFIPLFVLSQVEKKPLYAPRGEKHRNTYDAKGKQGTWKFFTLNKDLFLEVNYENDLKNGPCIRYYTSTAGIREEINYYYGVKEGDYKSYFVSGATRTEGTFKKNRRDGHWIFYYASTGEKSTEGDYLNGRKVDEWIYYNRKGEMTCKGNYKNDVKDGVWRYYDSDGKELKSENYVKTEAPKTPVNNNKYIPKSNKSTVPNKTQSPAPTTIISAKDKQDANKQISKPPANNLPSEPVSVVKEDTIKKINKVKINYTPSK